MVEKKFVKVGNYLDYTPKEMQELLDRFDQGKIQTKLYEFGFERE